jgi:hypothetical protein
VGGVQVLSPAVEGSSTEFSAVTSDVVCLGKCYRYQVPSRASLPMEEPPQQLEAAAASNFLGPSLAHF